MFTKAALFGEKMRKNSNSVEYYYLVFFLVALESGMYVSMLLCMCVLMCACDPTDGRVRVRC